MGLIHSSFASIFILFFESNLLTYLSACKLYMLSNSLLTALVSPARSPHASTMGAVAEKRLCTVLLRSVCCHKVVWADSNTYSCVRQSLHSLRATHVLPFLIREMSLVKQTIQHKGPRYQAVFNG